MHNPVSASPLNKRSAKDDAVTAQSIANYNYPIEKNLRSDVAPRGSEPANSAEAYFAAHYQSSHSGSGRKQVKKLLITTAALTLGLSAVMSLVSESQAAPTSKPTKSAYCDMAKSQRDPVSWNARYNCLDKERVAAARAEARTPATKTHAKNPYCDMAKSQRNPVSWNAQYGCLSSR